MGFARHNYLVKCPIEFYDRSLRCPGVYSITSLSSGKAYIGSSVNVAVRWRAHYWKLAAGIHHSQHLQSAWKKNGADDFIFAIIERTDRDNLRQREQVHIDAVGARMRFNMTPTAGSLLGFKMDPSTVEVRRRAHTGFRHTEEFKARSSRERKGICPRPPGWKQTEEGKRKLSLARKGKPQSPEHSAKSSALLTALNKRPKSERQKRLAAERKRKFTNEQVIALREAYLEGISIPRLAEQYGAERHSVARAVRGEGLYGSIGTAVLEVIKRPVYEETRQKLSNLAKGSHRSEATKAKMVEAWKRRKIAWVLTRAVPACQNPM